MQQEKELIDVRVDLVFELGWIHDEVPNIEADRDVFRVHQKIKHLQQLREDLDQRVGHAHCDILEEQFDERDETVSDLIELNKQENQECEEVFLEEPKRKNDCE